MKKKNIIIIFIAIIFIVLFSLIIDPFKLSKTKGFAIGNKNFKDQNFYSGVVTGFISSVEYFSESELYIAYDAIYDVYEMVVNMPDDEITFSTISLDDEALLFVKDVQASDVSDLSGIEKLTNLNNIYITGDIKKINLTHNDKLVSIAFDIKKLEEILLNKNEDLQKLSLSTDDFYFTSEGFVIRKKDVSIQDIKNINFNNLTVKIYEDENLSNEVLSETTDLDGKYIQFTDNNGFSYVLSISKEIEETPETQDNDYYINITNNIVKQQVIETYNTENNTSYDMSHTFKKSEVKKIKKLNINCDNQDMTLYDLFDFTNLEELSLNYCNFSDNNNIGFEKLKKLSISNNQTLEKIYTYDYKFKNLEELTLNNNPNFESLGIISLKLKTLDITGSSNNLKYLYVLSFELEDVFGLVTKSLETIQLPFSHINSKIDLSNSMIYLAKFNFSEITKTKMNLLVGDYIPLEYKVKLPEYLMDDEVYNEDDYIASYDSGFIKANHTGNTTMMNYYYPDFQDMTSLPLRTYVYVYDISSNKYNINKEYRYIYTGSEIDEKVINRYVKVKGNKASKKVKNNKFEILDEEGNKIFTFDIIHIDSSAYIINDNTILYSGNFDISKINVTNGNLVAIEDNKLQLIHNDVLVKQFNLERSGD